MATDRMAIVLDFLGGLLPLATACPHLRSLGAIECSWTNPSLYFDPLPVTFAAQPASGAAADGAPDGAAGMETCATEGGAAADGAANELGTVDVATAEDSCGWSGNQRALTPLSELLCLRLYINSPSGCPNGLDTEWGCASADDPSLACALSYAVHNVLYRLPSVQRLHIEWYEEHSLDVRKLARVLYPLAAMACSSVREIHLLRFNSDCGLITKSPDDEAGEADGGGERELEEAEASSALQALLPTLRISVCYHGQQTRNGKDAPDWLAGDSAGICTATRGLAYVY